MTTKKNAARSTLLAEAACSTLRLEIGPLCDAPSKQLAGKIPDDELKHLDKDADALSRLYVRGHLTSTEWSKAGRRIIEKATKLYVSNAPGERRGEQPATWIWKKTKLKPMARVRSTRWLGVRAAETK